MPFKRRLVARITLRQCDTEAAREKTHAYLCEAGFTEVMLIPVHGIAPAHPRRERILAWAQSFETTIKYFRAAGFGVSINNHFTIGHRSGLPADLEKQIQPLVEADGQVLEECLCPLGANYLEHIAFLYSTWASLQPDEIWIDDDFRYKTKTAQCFCPLHLQQLEKETGRAWTREELVGALRCDSNQKSTSDLTTVWNDIQRQGLLNAARHIADAVHRVNPEIPIGLMGVLESVEHYGLHYFKELLSILNPKGQPLVRPEFQSYHDGARLNWTAYRALWSCQRAFGENFTALQEYETWPLTQFNHSNRVLRMKHCWAAVHGFRHVAESVYWDNTRLHYEPHLPAYQNRTFEISSHIAEAIADADLISHGVALELSQSRLDDNKPAPLHSVDTYATNAVARLGIPLWPEEPLQNQHGVILTGNAPLMYLDSWDELIQRGVVLDREAFDVVRCHGKSTLMESTFAGVHTKPFEAKVVNERFTDTSVNGAAAGSSLFTAFASAWRDRMDAIVLPEGPNVEVLSWFEDADGNCLASAVWAMETPAGRVAVLPFSFADFSCQYIHANWKRKSQLEGVLEWVARKPLPVKIAGAADLLCIYRASQQRDRVVIGLANFSLDTADDVVLTVPLAAEWRSSRLRLLGENGDWREVETSAGSGAKIALGGAVAVESHSVCLLELRREDTTN